MIKEAIILAGGLGTRLRDTVPGLPKCMAPVAGRPFLFYLINYLRSQGIGKFVFSLGHLHELVEDYLAAEFATLDYQCSIEKEPLGTGGAILLACNKVTEKNVAVVNGDTLFRADLHRASLFHDHQMAECTILLKPMKDFDRYGVVQLNPEQLVTAFREKQFYASGHINAGVYLLHVPRFQDEELPGKFSFEKDYLEKYFDRRRIYGQIQDVYFIDIGVPSDYNRVQQELSPVPLDLKSVNKDWTLFLDRDGVINYEKEDDYIRDWREFRFYEGVPEVFPLLSQKFGRIIIVSNQRGVGRGLMTEPDLRIIHEHMRQEIESAGGRIDSILYCTSPDNLHPDRKPNPGMAFHAQKEFPEIDLARSIMVGNKLSDMKFARHAGMYSVLAATTHPETPFPHPDIDLRVNSLPEFANTL